MNPSKLLHLGLSALFVACTACGADDSGGGGSGGAGGSPPVGTPLVVRGMVTEGASSGGESAPLAGAAVRIGVDRDGNGSFAGAEMAETTTDDEGAYTVSLPVVAGERAVVSFESEGLASQFRTIVAGAKGDARIDVTLAELEVLTCKGTSCATAGSRLRIDGLPDGASGSARLFNPVTEPNAFPGAFVESTGKLLISGVFSAVELTDDQGTPIGQLASKATLRMALPVETWGIIIDIHEGTGAIEVPLYAFDETLGTWVRDGEAHLEDGTGAVIAESELPSIRDGSFAGVVTSVGEVGHFSYWNVDWPVDSHGCVTGIVVDTQGKPVQGASVLVRGTTYSGSSETVTTGADGRFCVDVMRSEGAGEDVDQDGVNGETQRVLVRIAYDGKVYEGGEFPVDVGNASCGTGPCTDLGPLDLSPAKQLAIALCTVTGTVLDRSGAPLPETTVGAYDDTLDTDDLWEICGEYFEKCPFVTTSAADGSFSITTGMIDALNVFGMASIDFDPTHTAYRYGDRWFASCPKQPVNLVLEEGFDSYELAVSVAGNKIAWQPNLPIQMLQVTGESLKWVVYVEEGSGFVGPVTYGVTPAGATVIWPVDGSPAPLESGDSILVSSYTSTTTDGYPILATGTGVVP